MKPDDQAPPPMPELHHGSLDAPTVSRYFEDLRLCAQDILCLPRTQARSTTPPQPVPLAEAAELWGYGRISGLQVRYRHEGVAWWDTLLRQPDGTTKLVRMRESKL